MNYRTIEKFPFLNTLINIQLDRLVGRKKVKTIIDVGAYDGSYDLYLSRTYKQAKVFAIEPCGQSFKLLKKNTSRFPNILRHRLLISDSNGKESLFVETRNELPSQGNSVFADFMARKQNVTEETVKSITLWDFCEENGISEIDLMVINCEGGEYKIFDHILSNIIFGGVRVLSLALHGKSKLFRSKQYNEKKRQINRFLLNVGFELVHGDNLSKLDKLPKGHVQQVWIKE